MSSAMAMLLAGSSKFWSARLRECANGGAFTEKRLNAALYWYSDQADIVLISAAAFIGEFMHAPSTSSGTTVYFGSARRTRTPPTTILSWPEPERNVARAPESIV